MHLTARRLNRATLARQLLLERARLDVVEATHRITALQAQEPGSPYLALWDRIADFDPARLDRAFADHQVVKATLFRITLHAVAAEDYPAFHAAVTPTLRAARFHDARFRRTGLTPADADELMPELLRFAATPRTGAEGEAWADRRLGVTPRPGVWWAFRHVAPMWHQPTGGPWSFGSRSSFVAARPVQEAMDAATGMVHVVRRCLASFGPSTVNDLAQFTTIYVPPVRAAIATLGDELVRYEGPAGETLYDVADGLLPDEEVPAPPRLLAMWDSSLLASRDRSRLIPPDYRRLVIRSNGDVLPTLLVDGLVAGVWRPVQDGVEVTAFRPIARDAWRALEAEAVALGAFLASRDPALYRRYARWWADLPAAEVRRLAA